MSVSAPVANGKSSYLSTRAIVPTNPDRSEDAIASPAGGWMSSYLPWATRTTTTTTPSPPQTRPLPDPRNIQGDVYLVFPKKFEYFLFFDIKDATLFRKHLHRYSDLITSAAKTIENIYLIDKNESEEEPDVVSYGISFSRAGLKKLASGGLDVDKPLGDCDFDKSPNTKGDGIIVLATMRDYDTAKKQFNDIKDMFEGSIAVLRVLEGRVRPGNRVFFDWKDGISQPALEGLVVPWPGQLVVKPGVIVLGYAGDPVYDDDASRPDFTKDGSFMVFKKFGQSIPLFEEYIEANWELNTSSESEKNLTPDERKELFGARLFGRFKSGVPLALCPYKEDLAYLDPNLINNFDYSEEDKKPKCPLFSHTRKTNPRSGSCETKLLIRASQIIRASIPYGDEITDQEREEYRHLPEERKDTYDYERRGLLFVSYQSSTSNGFHRQIKNAHDFNFPSGYWESRSNGQDPITGNPRTVLQGVAGEPEDPKRFVHMFKDPQGTYFVPGISTVKAWATPN